MLGERGVLEKLYRNVLQSSFVCTTDNTIQASLLHTVGAFAVLLLGVAVSLLILTAEWAAVRCAATMRSGSGQGQVRVRSGSGQGRGQVTVRSGSGSGRGQVGVRVRSGSGQVRSGSGQAQVRVGVRSGLSQG